jgi:hypothetical protein
MILGFKINKRGYANYLDYIGLSWLKSILKYLAVGLISTILIVFIYLIYFIIVPYSYEYAGFTSLLDDSIYFGIQNFILIFWQEIVFHGILLSILLGRFKNKINAIHLNSLFLSLYYVLRINLIFGPVFRLRLPPFFTIFYEQDINLFYLILIASFIYSSYFIAGYLFYKTRSLISGLIFNLIIMYFTYWLSYLLFPFIG